jgi:hypothetical protein
MKLFSHYSTTAKLRLTLQAIQYESRNMLWLCAMSFGYMLMQLFKNFKSLK